MRDAQVRIDPRVIRSLMRSNVRSDIIRYLAKKYPNSAYLAEIEKAIKSSRCHLLGALFGKDDKYSEEHSLVALGLVDVLTDDGYKYYVLTGRGLKVAQNLSQNK